MANSTWLQITDEVLRLCRLRTIKTAAIFDSDPSTLSSFQSACKFYTKFCHQFMSVRAREWFNLRVIDLAIDSVTSNATFPLDTGISAEALKPHTFFNNSVANSSHNGPLEVWSPEYFDTLYPVKANITTGPPQAVVLYPPSRTDESPVYRVRVFPNPNASYLLQYKAHLNGYPLVNGSTKILWPFEYEHVITGLAWELMEAVSMGEGKEGPLMAMAQKAASDVFLVGSIPTDIRRGVKMFRMGSMRSPRTIRSPNDATNQVPLGPYWP